MHRSSRKSAYSTDMSDARKWKTVVVHGEGMPWSKAQHVHARGTPSKRAKGELSSVELARGPSRSRHPGTPGVAWFRTVDCYPLASGSWGVPGVHTNGVAPSPFSRQQTPQICTVATSTVAWTSAPAQRGRYG